MLGQNLSKLHLSDIFSARQRLPRAFSKTPLLSSELLNLQVKANLYLKAESLQPSGAYKIRGAYNKCAYLVEQHGSRLSIITASSGNHGMACAMAAAKLGICAKVVVPVSTPEIKKNCIRSLGAELIEHGENGKCVCLVDSQIVAKKIDEALTEVNKNNQMLYQLFEDLV